jgi:hypothetical protein
LLPLALLAGVRAAKADDCVDYSAYLHTLSEYKTSQAMRNVEVDGGLAYVAGDSSGLLIFDVSNPGTPVMVGSLDSLGATRDVKHVGDLVYVAGGEKGLEIVDVTNPTNPVLVGSVDTPGFARRVVLDGIHAYIADRDSGGLQVADVSNPNLPVIVGAIDTPGQAYSVAISQQRAYVADGLLGLQVFDISDPTSPAPVGSLSTPGTAFDVVLADTLAYVADLTGGLQIISISNPAYPVPLGEAIPAAYYAYGVKVVGTTAFLANDLYGLQVVDVADPSAPVIIGGLTTFMDAVGIDVDGQEAYVVGFPDFEGQPAGLQVIDIAPPLSPPLHLWTGAGFSLGDVAVKGGIAYYGSGSSFRIADVSNPSAPTALGSYGFGDDVANIAVDGNLAVVEAFGLQFVDVSNPAAPTLKATQYLAPGGVAIQGSYVYLGSYYGGAVSGPGFRVIDASDPASPAVVGTLLGIDPGELALQGARAYGLDRDLGLVVIDISNPAAPALLGSTPVDVEAMDVAVSGLYAYVAGYRSGLQIVDISDPASPSLVAELPLPVAAFGIRVAGQTAYLTCDIGGLQVVDVSTPTNPKLLGTSQAGAVRNLDLDGNYMYLTNFGTIAIAPVQCPDLVPVVLSSFEALSVDGAIEVRWRTASELNHAGFYLERSDANGVYARVSDLIVPPGPYVFRDENVSLGTTYDYQLESLNRDGTSTLVGSVRVVYRGAFRNRLGVSRPNPFHAGSISTRIDFDTARSDRTTLRILDVTGAEVRVLVDASLPPGPHVAMWDGRDKRGQRAAAGTYFYQLVSGSFSKTERLVVTP